MTGLHHIQIDLNDQPYFAYQFTFHLSFPQTIVVFTTPSRSTPLGAPLADCGFDTPLRQHSGLLNHHCRSALTLAAMLLRRNSFIFEWITTLLWDILI